MIYSISDVPTFTILFLIFGLFLKVDQRKQLLIFLNLFLLLLINGLSLSILFFLLFVLNYLPNILPKINNRWARNVLVFINVSVLFSFKLLPFIEKASFLAPLGMSLFIFQQIAFIIDREKDLGLSKMSLRDFFVYSFLFTNFFSGPVSKISTLFKQKASQLMFKKNALNHGFFLIFCGIFQKLVIADNIAVLTKPMLEHDLKAHDFDITLSFLLNKYEIFANFNGFSDIAIGSALIMGIELPKNFNRPFHVTTLTEFWKRWHISLINWIREYVFFPIVLSPLGKLGVPFSLLLTFTVFGLWHEVKMTFFLYSIVQVLIILGEKKISKRNDSFDHRPFLIKKTFYFFKWCFFYIVLISVPGILFRSENVDQFITILHKLKQSSLTGILNTIIFYKGTLLPIVIGIIFYEYISCLKRENIIEFIEKQRFVSRLILFSVIAFLILLLKSSYTGNGFIYANF